MAADTLTEQDLRMVAACIANRRGYLTKKWLLLGPCERGQLQQLTRLERLFLRLADVKAAQT